MKERLRPMIAEKVRDVPVPRMFRVKQIFPQPRLEPEQIPAVLTAELREAGLADRVRPGMRIAITVGSRGVANVALITKTIVDFVKACGAQPFIVPAMGSHGGATAEGQQKIVEDYGCTEAYLGCPIRSSMEVVPIGVNDEGKTVYIDKYAAQADGIIVNCRVKPHSAFRGKYESGIMKMMAIGLGKQYGAEVCHDQGIGCMAKNIPLFGRCILKNAPVLFAVAAIENAFDETARIAVVPAEDIEAVEPGLLEEAKANMPRILVDEADVLIVDQMGKNFSGDGMDPNITGNFPTPYASGGLKAQRVGVLNLSPESHGNAIGAGNCSVMTQRIFDQIDLCAMYMNCITCTIVSSSRIPVIMESDRECLQMCLRTCVNNDKQHPRVVRIPNSLHIEHIMLSEAYWDQAQKNPNLEIESQPEDWPFDENGDLPMRDGTILF